MIANPPLTVADVAARFGVGPATVLAWIAAGELVAVNVSRSPHSKKPRWRVTAAALVAFETRRSPAPPAEQTPRRRNRLHRSADFVVYFP